MEVRAKAAEILVTEVKPRAEDAWRRARPTLESARDELLDIAAENDPRKDPKAFAAAIRKRFKAREDD